jgi:hypothetical protein
MYSDLMRLAPSRATLFKRIVLAAVAVAVVGAQALTSQPASVETVLMTGKGHQFGVARARDKLDAQSFDVVVGVVERVNLEFAAIARTRVDLPDRQCAAQQAQDLGMPTRAMRLNSGNIRDPAPNS